MKILIKTVGFIGDILFASSIATKIKKSRTECSKIDYLIRLPQPLELLNNNPDIDNVFLEHVDESQYDIVYNLRPIHRALTPCEQFQIQCDIPNPSPEYRIYTNPGLDLWTGRLLRTTGDARKVIGVLENWEERSFLFTEEEYKRGVDVPNLGYGGKRRNIGYIVSELAKLESITLIPVGKPNGFVSDRNIDHNTVSEYSWTASILKNCDYFIGAEGGLCNLAAGVGTKTIITGDFVHQLYGWNGVIEKCEEPKLGPKFYFTTDDHITLNPYLTDKQVLDQITKIICEDVV